MPEFYKNRIAQGAFHNLIQEMRLSDTKRFVNYLRMTSEIFNWLLRVAGPSLTKLHQVREPISSAERLAFTLRIVLNSKTILAF